MASNLPISGNWHIYQNLRGLTLTGLQILLVTTALKFIQILKADKISVNLRHYTSMSPKNRLRISKKSQCELFVYTPCSINETQRDETH